MTIFIAAILHWATPQLPIGRLQGACQSVVKGHLLDFSRPVATDVGPPLPELPPSRAAATILPRRGRKQNGGGDRIVEKACLNRCRADHAVRIASIAWNKRIQYNVPLRFIRLHENVSLKTYGTLGNQ
jgi:hypothetical protein